MSAACPKCRARTEPGARSCAACGCQWLPDGTAADAGQPTAGSRTLKRVVRRRRTRGAPIPPPPRVEDEPCTVPIPPEEALEPEPEASPRAPAVTPPEEFEGFDPGLAERFAPVSRLDDGPTDCLYLALDRDSTRLVALRIARPGDHGVRRCAQEVRLLETAAHVNIVTLVGHGIAGGAPWIAYQYLEGLTARDRLLQGPIEARAAGLAAAQIADGLEAIHRAGWVHRDLAPERVRDSGTGLAKLLGFARALPPPGMAPLDFRTRPDLRYVAPENALGERPGPASDVYSLGAVLYEMLTGRAPFVAGSESALIVKLTSEDPAPPSARAPLPAGYDTVVLRALAKDPQQRFPTARALADALRELAG